ncbi:MAG: DNA repair protein RecO [Bdellovibrionaceae bacterium]|nr:DNA repair protein RecO [Pseudobdellovibrionaceae bacterium]
MDTKNKFIILKKVRYGEADLILQALSTHGEKMSFMARGALKSRRRFGGGVLEPCHFVQFTYHQSKTGKLHTLKEASLINDFPGLRRDYDRLEFALRAVDAVGKVSQEGDATAEFLFNLLGHVLSGLERADDLTAIKLQFWLKFLMQQGVLTPEPWMTPFLKANLADAPTLAEPARAEARRIVGLEMIIEQYVRNATL